MTTTNAPFPSQAIPYCWHVIRHQYLPQLGLLVTLTIAAQIAESTAPYLLGSLIDVVATNAGSHAAIRPFAFLVACWLAAFVCQRLSTVVDIYTMPPIRGESQKMLLAYLFGHSPRFFQENFAGALGIKIKHASESVIQLLGFACIDIPKIITVFLTGLSLLYLLKPGYALFLAGWAIVYLAISVSMAKRCVHYSAAFTRAVTTLTGARVDAISNFDVVRSFAGMDHEQALIGEKIDAECRSSQRLRSYLAKMSAFQAASMVALLAGFIWMAVQDGLAGKTSAGALASVFGLATVVIVTLQNLSFRMLDIFQHIGTLQEALDDFAVPHEITDAPDAKPLIVAQGHIQFSGIHFSHPDGTEVFDGLNLDIAPGEKVGLVGPSGAGKSTLIKLLRRQYEPQAGNIIIDDQNIAHVTWRSLNEAIAEVPQVAGIFHRSALDNLRYAQHDMPEEQVIQYAIEAHCHEFIERRPEKYQVMVGERGVKLSGGERQRVAIARALIKNSRILILDEATSSLDSASESLIQEALWKLFEGRTVIAIAHRLSTITGMDRILYLDHGRIIESGSHEELLNQNGLYAKLWSLQMRGFIS